MPKAVRFEQYGGPEVLRVVEVEAPTPGPGELVVRVKAAGLNLGEAKIRSGFLHDRFPATFPSGEGSDFAGIVEAVGAEVDHFSVGDEVAGFTDDRASHADVVLVHEANLTPKPQAVSWEVAGSLFVAGTTAYAAVRAVAPVASDTIVIAGAAGGVGGIACQLAKRAGARVIGTASIRDHDWLRSIGVEPVSYEGDLSATLRHLAPHIDAFIDTAGHGNVKLAIELGVDPNRIDTIIDFPAVEQFGVKADGNAAAGTSAVLAELLALIADGELEVPIAKTFALTDVQEAFDYLESKTARRKVVLLPNEG